MAIGISLPATVIPVRAALGYQNNQYTKLAVPEKKWRIPEGVDDIVEEAVATA